MITVDDAKRALENKYKDIDVQTAYDYSDRYYMFTAPTNGSINEPYYIVEKSSGRARYLNPLEDFDAFCSALEEHQIKDYRGLDDR